MDNAVQASWTPRLYFGERIFRNSILSSEPRTHSFLRDDVSFLFSFVFLKWAGGLVPQALADEGSSKCWDGVRGVFYRRMWPAGSSGWSSPVLQNELPIRRAFPSYFLPSPFSPSPPPSVAHPIACALSSCASTCCPPPIQRNTYEAPAPSCKRPYDHHRPIKVRMLSLFFVCGRA